jgi:hypothetical protein
MTLVVGTQSYFVVQWVKKATVDTKTTFRRCLEAINLAMFKGSISRRDLKNGLQEVKVSLP